MVYFVISKRISTSWSCTTHLIKSTKLYSLIPSTFVEQDLSLKWYIREHPSTIPIWWEKQKEFTFPSIHIDSADMGAPSHPLHPPHPPRPPLPLLKQLQRSHIFCFFREHVLFQQEGPQYIFGHVPMTMTAIEFPVLSSNKWVLATDTI